MTWYVIPVLVILLAAFIAAWCVPRVQVSRIQLKLEEKLKLENDIRSTLIQAVGGFLVVVGLFLNLWQLKQSSDVADQNARDAERHAQEERLSGSAERFSKAVEAISRTDMASRLGAIRFLELEYDQRGIFADAALEQLLSFLRRNLSENVISSACHPPGTPYIPLAAVNQGARAAEPDIRAAFESLSRLRRKNRITPLDLECLNLDQADLHALYLSGSDFGHSNLRAANLFKADLSGAIFNDSHLESSEAWCAEMARAVFKNAHLSHKTSFGYANLESTYWKSAQPEGRVDFSRANLRHSEMDDEFVCKLRHVVKANLVDVRGLREKGRACAKDNGYVLEAEQALELEPYRKDFCSGWATK